MHRKEDERWLRLCAQAAVEKDRDKLLALVREINELLEARAKATADPASDSSSLKPASNE